MAERTASWDKPGPGTWELDQSHCGPAPGPVQRGIYAHSLPTGIGEGLAEFGAPLKTMEMRWVHGKFYRRLVPQVGGGSDLPPPPKPILWLASRLHPTLRAQERRAKESFETKRWRAEMARWEREWKPALIAANLADGEVDLPGLDDAALAAHLDDLHRRLLDSCTL